MSKNRISAGSKKPPLERTGVKRLYRYAGPRKVSFVYVHGDNRYETLTSAPRGDRAAIRDAEADAKRKALDVQQGKVVAGSVADLIDRFQRDIAPTHYRDQSKDGQAVRESAYRNLTKAFGKMHPAALKAQHGYSYLDARAQEGAPMKANKELALMSTMCQYAVRWGVMEVNPFRGLMQNQGERKVRATQRHQVIRFYLWSRKQSPQFQTLGCAALFTYLTGFRAAEVRPFTVDGITDAGVLVASAKRKKGEAEVLKLRRWSPKLRLVVARAKQAQKKERTHLFPNRFGAPYSRSGWGSVWQDAMAAWLGTKDDLVKHPDYFSLLDVRPAAITTKMTRRDADMLDFAGHANPATTYRHYDRRKIKEADATE